MKRIILVVSAVATVLLGLDKIGSTPIAPGTDLGVTWNKQTSAAAPSFAFTTDAGDIECVLEVSLAGSKQLAPWDALLDPGLSLHVDAAWEDEAWRLRISGKGKNAFNRPKFSWPRRRVRAHAAGTESTPIISSVSSGSRGTTAREP